MWHYHRSYGAFAGALITAGVLVKMWAHKNGKQ